MLLTVLAGALEKHLRHRRDSRPLLRARSGCDRDVHVIQTRHLTATGADEVRMIAAVSAAILVPFHLEPPDMVTEVDPRHKPGLGEFREISIDGGPIEAAMIKLRRHLRMRPGPRGRQHVLQDRQPGGRAPKPCPTNKGFHGID